MKIKQVLLEITATEIPSWNMQDCIESKKYENF
jgi:hypothetical protein